MSAPKVYLVGAGPGDPDLLTVRAMRLIQEAKTLVYDRLVSREILRLAPEGCARIYVGKATGRHTLPQREINLLLVDLARKGQEVVRLKGGDPGIFGRGGEEAEILRQHGISYEIVPGITAAQACAAGLGIALTQRGVARKLTVLSGHCKNNEDLFFNEYDLADPSQTIVIYMGLNNAEQIRSQFQEVGRDLTTPVAIIENGSTPRERRILTCIADLPQTIAAYAVVSPAMLIVGDVVMASQLALGSTSRSVAAGGRRG